MARLPPAVVAVIKAELIERISDGAVTSDALAALGVNHTQLRYWCKTDSSFAEELREAQETCTELKADSILELHNIVVDPKRAAVASRNLETWLRWRNPKTFGLKPTDSEDRPQLLEVLRAAIARIPVDQPQPVRLIEASSDSNQQ